MKKPIIALLTLTLLSTAAQIKAAEFTCEKIKDRQVRTLCAQDRNEKEKAAADAAIAQEKEKAGAAEREKEAEKAVSLAKVALKELKRLDVRVGTGISYADYPAALSNAKFEVRQFTESQSAKSLSDVAATMILAIEHYDNAHELWAYKFDGSGPPAKVISTYFKEQKKAVESFETKYKGISEFDYGQQRIFIDKGILVIWKAASIEIKKAEYLLEK